VGIEKARVGGFLDCFANGQQGGQAGGKRGEGGWKKKFLMIQIWKGLRPGGGGVKEP